MKKTLILMIALAMLTGCSFFEKTQEKVEFNNHTINKLNDKFEYVNAKCLRNDAMIEYSTVNRGDEIGIIDEDDKYYYFNKDNLTLAILKDFVRTENEEPFESFTGYARSGRGIYTNYDLKERIKKLSLNDEVNVIDGFLGVYYVEYEGTYGYMDEDSISRSKISTYVAPKITEQAPTSDGGSSHSHHDDGGGGSPAPAPEPKFVPSFDEPEINLHTFSIRNDDTVQCLAYVNEVKGIVLADKIVVYLSVLQRGDAVNVVEENDDICVILIQGRKAKIEKDYIRLDSEEKYESWIGYTYGSSPVYYDYEMNNRIKRFDINDEVEVIDKIKDVCVVQLEDGLIGYMDESNISEEEIYIAPKKVEVEVPAASDGGGSSHSHHDDGGGSPAPAPEPSSGFSEDYF